MSDTLKLVLTDHWFEEIKSCRGLHPTQKPVKLFETLIKLCADKNKVVLDCFSGSGTTAIACHRLGIPFICIEKDKDYWEASIKRLEQEQKQLTMF